MERKIRDFINNTHRISGELSNEIHTQVCACLDAIGDTEQAFVEYLRGYKNGYIVVYGVLQALYIQSDAVKSLYDCLLNNGENKYKFTDEIQEIRNIRNDIAHLTNRSGKNYNFLFRGSVEEKNSQITFSKYNGSTHLLTNPPDIMHVDIEELISKQREQLEQPLDDILLKLKEDEKQYRNGFKGKELYPPLKLTTYPLQKVCQVINGDGSSSLSEFGKHNLNVILNIINEYYSGIEKRWPLGKYERQEKEMINRAISNLEDFFKENTCINYYDAKLFYISLECLITKLLEQSKEIDEYFSEAL